MLWLSFVLCNTRCDVRRIMLFFSPMLYITHPSEPCLSKFSPRGGKRFPHHSVLSTWSTPGAPLPPLPSLEPEGSSHTGIVLSDFISNVAHDWILHTPHSLLHGSRHSSWWERMEAKRRGLQGFRRKRVQGFRAQTRVVAVGIRRGELFLEPTTHWMYGMWQWRKNGSLLISHQNSQWHSEPLSYLVIRIICDCFSIVYLLDCELQEVSE